MFAPFLVFGIFVLPQCSRRPPHGGGGTCFQQAPNSTQADISERLQEKLLNFLEDCHEVYY
jgi:hypothetical protein